MEREKLDEELLRAEHSILARKVPAWANAEMQLENYQ